MDGVKKIELVMVYNKSCVQGTTEIGRGANLGVTQFYFCFLNSDLNVISTPWESVIGIKKHFIYNSFQKEFKKVKLDMEECEKYQKKYHIIWIAPLTNLVTTKIVQRLWWHFSVSPLPPPLVWLFCV